MAEALGVTDQGLDLSFTFADLIAYHGPHSPGGVAHAYKVLELVLPLLEPGGLAERRAITIRTAFGGPGARDGFELVTRAVSEDRYVVDESLARPERGRAAERFVFELSHRERTVTVTVRDGFVTDEFIDLARREDRTAAEEERLGVMKLHMADLVMSRAADDVYDLLEMDEGSGSGSQAEGPG